MYCNVFSYISPLHYICAFIMFRHENISGCITDFKCTNPHLIMTNLCAAAISKCRVNHYYYYFYLSIHSFLIHISVHIVSSLLVFHLKKLLAAQKNISPVNYSIDSCLCCCCNAPDCFVFLVLEDSGFETAGCGCVEFPQGQCTSISSVERHSRLIGNSECEREWLSGSICVYPASHPVSARIDSSLLGTLKDKQRS